MTVWHCTPSRNLDSIREGGIDPDYAQSDAKRSWYVTSSNLEWAICHVAARHHVPYTDVVALPVQIPRGKLTRFRRGVWYCTEVQYPEV